MTHRRFCISIIILALTLSGCSRQGNISQDGNVADSECSKNDETNGIMEDVSTDNVNVAKTSIDDILLEFENNDYTIVCESVEPQILTGSRYLLTFSGPSNGRITIYEYESFVQAQADADCIDESGSTVILEDQTHYIEWKSVPHFYQYNNLIIQYVGTDKNILNLLTNLLGTQFAGGDTE